MVNRTRGLVFLVVWCLVWGFIMRGFGAEADEIPGKPLSSLDDKAATTGLNGLAPAIQTDTTTTLRLESMSGNEQVVLENQMSDPFVLRVVDTSGAPQPGRAINLSIGHAPGRSEHIRFNPPFIITDPVGQASFSYRAAHPGEYRFIAHLADDPTQAIRFALSARSESWVMYLMFGLAGGLGLFLFGMNLGAEGLQKLAGKKMKNILSTFTTNRYLGVLTGVIITAITQSSSATTVMLVGFVNAALMSVSQTLSVIMGANVGTTITVQLIAFDISHYALLMIGIGFVLKSSKKRTTSYAGDIVLGFGMIFFGMKVMSTAMAPLRNEPAFKDLLISISQYPISAIIGSMIFTSLIQSSGATIGLLVVFASQDLITLQSAVPLILGAQIGTCITGWIAAIGGSVESKQTAVLNVVFNFVGTIVFLPFLYERAHFGDFVQWCSAPFGASPARIIANAHMISAVLKVVILLPFSQQLVDLSVWLMPPGPREDERVNKVKFISENLLHTPELALGNTAREISRLAGHVEFMMQSVPRLISYGDDKLVAEVFFHEQKVDYLRAQITRYLSRLSENVLTEDQTSLMVKYMNIINDLECLGDMVHKIIVPFARRKKTEEFRFTEEGYRELLRMFDAVNGVFMQAINAFATNDTAMARKVLASDESMDQLEHALRGSHMRRVLEGRVQSVQTSTLHLDLLTCLKGIHHQAVNVAKAMIVGVPPNGHEHLGHGHVSPLSGADQSPPPSLGATNGSVAHPTANSPSETAHPPASPDI